jgi:hypothetical protein
MQAASCVPPEARLGTRAELHPWAEKKVLDLFCPIFVRIPCDLLNVAKALLAD